MPVLSRTAATPNLSCLWANPDQAGVLRKHAHKFVSGWQERFFVLEGSILYYFKDRKNVKTLHGIIPLEHARIQAEPPAGYLGKSGNNQHQHSLCITITLHVQHAYLAKYPFYVLLAPTPEVHSAWLAALRQASLPRATLLAKLHETGHLVEVVNECIEQTQLCFPTVGAAVISSSACVRLDQMQPTPRQEITTEQQQNTLVVASVLASAQQTPLTNAVSSPLVDSPTAAQHGGLIPSVGGKLANSRPVTEIHATVHTQPVNVGGHRSSMSSPGGNKKNAARISVPITDREIDTVGLRTTYQNPIVEM